MMLTMKTAVSLTRMMIRPQMIIPTGIFTRAEMIRKEALPAAASRRRLVSRLTEMIPNAANM